MGNVRKRGEKSWTLTWALPPDPATGKRRQGYETVRGTKRDALRVLAEREAAVSKGEHLRPSRQTVADYLAEWLDDDVATTTRATTTQGYRHYVRKHIVPKLGHIALRDLQPVHLQALYSGMLSQGLSATTTAQAHRIIRRALGQAVRRGSLASASSGDTFGNDPEAFSDRRMCPGISATNRKTPPLCSLVQRSPNMLSEAAPVSFRRTCLSPFPARWSDGVARAGSARVLLSVPARRTSVEGRSRPQASGVV